MLSSVTGAPYFSQNLVRDGAIGAAGDLHAVQVAFAAETLDRRADHRVQTCRAGIDQRAVDVP